MKKAIAFVGALQALPAYAQDNLDVLVYGQNTGYGDTVADCCEITSWYMTSTKSPENLLTACHNEGGKYLQESSVREGNTCEYDSAPEGSKFIYICTVTSSAICVR
jgi:hypothetical protein